MDGYKASTGNPMQAKDRVKGLLRYKAGYTEGWNAKTVEMERSRGVK